MNNYENIKSKRLTYLGERQNIIVVSKYLPYFTQFFFYNIFVTLKAKRTGIKTLPVHSNYLINFLSFFFIQ